VQIHVEQRHAVRQIADERGVHTRVRTASGLTPRRLPFRLFGSARILDLARFPFFGSTASLPAISPRLARSEVSARPCGSSAKRGAPPAFRDHSLANTPLRMSARSFRISSRTAD